MFLKLSRLFQLDGAVLFRVWCNRQNLGRGSILDNLKCLGTLLQKLQKLKAQGVKATDSLNSIPFF